MKVSDITAKEIANYLRITEMDVSLKEELETYLNVAIKYIKDETGLDDLDKNEDFVIAIYVLCQDMYDNRTFYVDKSNTNRVVETILGRHRINFLW